MPEETRQVEEITTRCTLRDRFSSFPEEQAHASRHGRAVTQALGFTLKHTAARAASGCRGIAEDRRATWARDCRVSRTVCILQNRTHVCVRAAQTPRGSFALGWLCPTGYGTDSQGLRGINGVTGPLMIH